MSDDVGTVEGADWPPAAPSTIRLRPRSAVARDGATPAVHVPPGSSTRQEPAAPAMSAPPAAATPLAAPPAAAVTPFVAPPAVTAARPTPVTAAAPPAAAVIAPAIPARSEGPIADPAWYRLRLVRDAAAALALVVAVGLVAALVAGPRPEGAVLSATSAPADPRGAPAMRLPDSAPSAARSPDPASGTAGSPSPTPAASGLPFASAPAPTDDVAP